MVLLRHLQKFLFPFFSPQILHLFRRCGSRICPGVGTPNSKAYRGAISDQQRPLGGLARLLQPTLLYVGKSVDLGIELE